MLFDKIIKARSSVRREEILKHQEKVRLYFDPLYIIQLDFHKRILMEHSPSRAKLDPIVS